MHILGMWGHMFVATISVGNYWSEMKFRVKNTNSGSAANILT